MGSEWGTASFNTEQVADNQLSAIDTFDIGSGKTQRLAAFADKLVVCLRWSRAGRGIFLIYTPSSNAFQTQIGFLSSAGNFRPITRDTNTYSTLTVSADARTLGTVQKREIRGFYLLPGVGSQSAEMTPPVFRANEIQFFNWTADGNLLASDNSRIWRMSPDGKNRSQLLAADSGAVIGYFSACGGEHIVFSRFDGGTNSANVWRMNADGSGAVQLTHGKSQVGSACSSDQEWVYYLDSSGLPGIGHVPLDGSGKPEAIPEAFIFGGLIETGVVGISPDGGTIAYSLGLKDMQTQAVTVKIALLNTKSLTAPRLLDANPNITGRQLGFSGGVQFTPDGRAVAYPVRENGVDNIWVQLLDGSAGHSITNFKSENIEEFHWSRDGKNRSRRTLHALLQAAR